MKKLSKKERQKVKRMSKIPPRRGWAKPKRRTAAYLSEDQHAFVVYCFMQGEKTGRKKVTAEEAVILMRSAKNEDGSNKFPKMALLKAVRFRSSLPNDFRKILQINF